MKRTLILFAAAALMLSCAKQTADTVITGKIYTAEDENPFVEAVAVKDGKWIYAGNKSKVQKYVKDGVTTVIDHTGKGLVMPSCTEGHAHYIIAACMQFMGGLVIDANDGSAEFLAKLGAACDKAKAEGKHNLFGFGWDYFKFNREGMPTLAQIDAVSKDIAIYISDSEGHKGFVNSFTLQKAGIIDKAGNVLIKEIRGGEIVMDKQGKPAGLLKEQAGSYVRMHAIDFDELLTDEITTKATLATREMLLSNGYTAYMDGWSNQFGNAALYEAARKLDQEGALNMDFCYSYEVESWCEDLEKAIAEAADWKKYATPHFHPDYLKIFMDGTVETGTGFTFDEYVTGGHGIFNWEQEEVDKITELANGSGLTMHVHTMGDAAINRCINAFEKCGNKDMRNCLVHLRNLKAEDYQRIADNNIFCTVGMLWHALSESQIASINAVIPLNCQGTSYPMKSHLDHGVVMSSSCDFPATSGMPADPFGIMEIAVTGSVPDAKTGEYTNPWDVKELITRDQALKVLTLNGSRQLGLDAVRGSIKPGKYADFILVDKDVLECPEREIHTAKVLATYYEGQQVYAKAE